MKQLLGIPNDTSICIRYTDAPHNTVGSLSALLKEPRHVIYLVVHPIRHFSNGSVTNYADQMHYNAIPITAKEPFYTFRGRHCNFSLNSERRNGGAKPVKEKWDRLCSQLAEINVYLQRTQKECDFIAEKCGNRKDTSTSSAGRHFKEAGGMRGGNVKNLVKHSVSSCSSSASSESGKGSMLDMVGEEEVDAASNLMSVQDHSHAKEMKEEEVKMEENEDERVERLLGIAQGLTHQFHQRKG